MISAHFSSIFSKWLGNKPLKNGRKFPSNTYSKVGRFEFKQISRDASRLGLFSLSSNDSIQTVTTKTNKVPLLIELTDHYPMAFDILWVLSFNSTIIEQLRSDRTFTAKLVQIHQQTTDGNLQKKVSGLLWNIQSERHETTVMEKIDEKPFDIMISYCQKDKDICEKLYEELSRVGYRVWIDFDQMHGNVMDAMAQAIEQSRTIIICMSEQYRRSNYCRAEAQYAFQKQVHIVPILLQKHYKPDERLSFLIRPLFYIDFTKYEYPIALEMLMKELKMAQKTLDSLNSLLVATHLTRSSSQSMILPANVKDWEETHVQHWLTKNDLPQLARILAGMDGLGLIYFGEHMMNNDLQQIVSSLQQDSLCLTNENVSMIEISRFRSLMEKENISRYIQKNKTDNKSNYSTCCNVMKTSTLKIKINDEYFRFFQNVFVLILHRLEDIRVRIQDLLPYTKKLRRTLFILRIQRKLLKNVINIMIFFLD
jgi:hypothetical protein